MNAPERTGSAGAAEDRRTVVVRGAAAGIAQKIEVGGNPHAAHQPVAAGGTDTGPNPYDFLLAALGT